MAKLIIDCLPYQKGKAYGYQQYIDNLLDYFYKNRHELNFTEIIIYCVDSQKCNFEKYATKMTIYGCKVSHITMRLVAQLFIAWNLNLKSEDVILFTGNYSSLIKKCRHVLVVHDLLFKRKQWMKSKLMKIQRKFYIPISIKLADKIIAISKFTANDLINYYPKSQGKIEVIYNHFNFAKYGEINRIIEKECYILSVCSSAYHKNTITLFDAFEDYVNNGGRFDLVLVGKIKGINYLEDRYDKLPLNVRNKIFFKTKITDLELSKLYQQANAYISCSLFEGLGMPIVEAMYFNLPLILTDGDVFREVSQNKALYVNPMDKAEIAKSLFQIEYLTFEDNQNRYDLSPFAENKTSGQYVQLLNYYCK